MNKYRLWLLSIILIAVALRLYNLTYHSLWFDEAISVHWARQTVPRILEVGLTLVEDRLPPLYYLNLKGWTTLLGFSEFSVRTLSVFYGVLLAPVMVSIATTLFNRRVAYLAGLLVALNPFLVWYAQEARMYAPAVLFSALTVWAYLRICEPANGEPANRRMANCTTPSTPRNTVLSHNLRPIRGAKRVGGRDLGGTLPKPPGLRRVVHHVARPVYSLLFILFAVAGLYTHLYTGFLLPALGLWLVISYPRHWRLWLTFALGGLIIALAFTPLAVATWHFSGEAAPGDPFSGPGGRAWWLLQAFTVWKAPLSPLLRIGLPAATAFFALAAYIPKKQTAPATQATGSTPPHHFGTLRLRAQPGPYLKRRAGGREHHPSPPTQFAIRNSPPKARKRHASRIPHPLLLVTLLLLCPFAVANLLLFRNYLAFFGERYFIVMIPWLLLLAAVGAGNLGKWASWRTASPLTPHTIRNTQYASRITHHASRIPFHLFPLKHIPMSLLLIATVLPIPGQWSVAAAKEAWRQSVAYLAEHARPNHAILIHPDWVRFPFQFYFRGPGQTYATFSNVTPETPLHGPLQGVVDSHPVVWLIQSHLDGPDPDRRVEQWFAARYPLVTELYPPGISLKGYAPGYQLDHLPAEANPVDLQFGNGMHLVGYQADRAASATDLLFHPPSGWVHVTLYWTASRPVTGEAVPYIELVGAEGRWGAGLERPNDALKLYPPSRWPPEAASKSIIRHDVDVNLNPDTPPGVYQLMVGMRGGDSQYALAKVEIR